MRLITLTLTLLLTLTLTLPLILTVTLTLPLALTLEACGYPVRLSSGLCQKVYCSSRLSGNVPLSSRRGTKVCVRSGLG